MCYVLCAGLALTDLHDRVPANCAYKGQHANPDEAQRQGAPSTTGLSACNSGVLVVNPSQRLYDLVLQSINDPSSVLKYEFPDQDLLSDLFRGRWVALPYVYNALKTMRQKNVHGLIWRDDEVRNVHYILTPKPWDYEPAHDSVTSVRDARNGGLEKSQSRSGAVRSDTKEADVLHTWWWQANRDRKAVEEENGILDGL